jgi:hypothetical protein
VPGRGGAGSSVRPMSSTSVSRAGYHDPRATGRSKRPSSKGLLTLTLAPTPTSDGTTHSEVDARAESVRC